MAASTLSLSVLQTQGEKHRRRHTGVFLDDARSYILFIYTFCKCHAMSEANKPLNLAYQSELRIFLFAFIWLINIFKSYEQIKNVCRIPGPLPLPEVKKHIVLRSDLN